MEVFLNILEVLKKYYKYVFVVILFIILGTTTCISGKGGEIEEDIKLEVNVPEITKDEKQEEEYVIVDIKGAVVQPGAYMLKSDKRIYDAIKASGGLTDNADTTLINLSKKLKDEMVIIVHTKEQVEEYTKKEPTVIYKEVECVCPELKNDGCVAYEETNEDKDDNKISLNEATLEELMTLPGIGEKKAKSIIEYRNQNEGFTSIEDLLEVKGIGELIFEQIKELITI